MKRYAPLACLAMALALGSCISVSFGKPKPRISAVLLDREAASGPIAMGRISAAPAQLISNYNGSMEDIVVGAAKRAGMAVKPSSAAAPEDLRLDFFVSQKSFMRGFDEYSSITLILTVKKAGISVAQLVYTRDSDTSLDSFANLYDILETVMPALAKEIPAVGK